ncbi:MAG: MoxR family ATPase [Planctomycetes bacterium]|nr:MoxR family ATPase [Planctomycetota bacterium]MCB9903595.1 MoxR family ATPase [Planctomycetota bacterium]
MGWIEEMRGAVAHAVVGMEDELRACLVAALAEGHCLLEGPPGVAKTLLVRSIAAALGGRYSRIQFTPDLMPSDVTGTGIYRPDKGQFEFKPGPIFANVLLCDEINRAPAKTQAALLEAMQEGAITIDGERHELPRPFLVFATQNPIEHEGTYPLPEAQLDRFLFKVLVGYPDAEVEARLLQDVHARQSTASPTDLGVQAVCSPDCLAELSAEARSIDVREDLPAYVVQLLNATRSHAALQVGASPRAGVMLLRAAKALALAEGRAYVLPDDIKRVFLPALRHRVLLEPAEEVEGGSTDAVLRSILDSIEVPR